MSSPSTIQLCSLQELTIELSDDIRQHLSNQYPEGSLDTLLQAMKRPPATTICRVNQILSSREEVMDGLRQAIEKLPLLQVVKHELFDDVVCILEKDPTIHDQSLFSSRVPGGGEEIFQDWPARKQNGWPMSHRTVVCDRFCGEAVLRGSDIFVRGILSADYGIQAGDSVAVYADIRDSNTKAVARGLLLEHYLGKCVFLGVGKAACSRSAFFRESQGVAVSMSPEPSERVGPSLPPLSGILQDKMMLQNLPSIVVGHLLDPRPHEIILDMCGAPGGKSSHLASLVRNQGTIVSCDRSRKKMVAAKALFERLGATCITPLALDSTKIVERDTPITERKSVKEIIESAQTSEKDGLKVIKRFFPESFDRILLDPPCSALGLRPKLFVVQGSLDELQKYASYQQKFVGEAVDLLKPGGVMTYSTCTINSKENECMVRHILDQYASLELLPIRCNLGLPGLSGFGLTEEERGMVRRFDPHDEKADTMGFFVALFRKMPHS